MTTKQELIEMLTKSAIEFSEDGTMFLPQMYAKRYDIAYGQDTFHKEIFTPVNINFTVNKFKKHVDLVLMGVKYG